jgi:hypothetical protein
MKSVIQKPLCLNGLRAAMLSAGLLLSQASCAAPSQEPDSNRVQSQQAQSQQQQTHVRLVFDGEITEVNFTPDELKDSAAIDNKLSALPDAQREKLGKLLKRIAEGKMPGMDEEFNKKLASLQAGMEEKQKIVEFHTQELRQRIEDSAKDLEERGRQIESLVKAHVPQDIHEWENEDKLEVMITHGDKHVFQMKHHDVTETMLNMLKHADLTEAQKAKLREALNQAN